MSKNKDRQKQTISDIRNAETIEELQELEPAKDGDGTLHAEFAAAKEKLEMSDGTAEKPTEAAKTKKPRERVDKQYRLLSTDVKWATQPQVHGLMSVIAKEIKVGDVVPESKIIELLSDPTVEKEVLKTRQGGKRIWDYYKGDHMVGLRAHKNFEVVEPEKKEEEEKPVEQPAEAQPVEATT